jgi:hypothetical protein
VHHNLKNVQKVEGVKALLFTKNWKPIRFYPASLTTEINVVTIRIGGREGVRVNPSIILKSYTIGMVSTEIDQLFNHW